MKSFLVNVIFKYINIYVLRFWRKIILRFILVERFSFMYETEEETF